MLTLETTNRFERELKRAKKRGKNLTKLWTIVDLLLSEQPLPPRNRNHKLGGNWLGHWECHIEPDWLLVYQIDGTILLLVANGTHSDLFE